MKLDSAFQIGKTHDICEDYALVSNDESPLPFAIVSDGCSSSKQTDTGARILTFSAIEQIGQLHQESQTIYSFNQEICISKARDIAKSLNISNSSLDATLLIATVREGSVDVRMSGDGYAAIGLKDGSICLINAEYPRGYPFYMNYLPKYSNNFQYWQDNYNVKEVHMSIIKDGKVIKEDSKILSGGMVFALEEYPIMVETYWDESTFFSIDFWAAEWVVLMSDGIGSFYQTKDAGTSLTNVAIDYREVISEVLNFKNFNGKFMQRRLNRFLKFCAKNNWHHADDISFGTIYFGDK